MQLQNGKPLSQKKIETEFYLVPIFPHSYIFHIGQTYPQYAISHRNQQIRFKILRRSFCKFFLQNHLVTDAASLTLYVKKKFQFQKTCGARSSQSTEIFQQLCFRTPTVQKMKFSIKDFFSKSDQIRRILRVWSHLLKKSILKDFIFCAVTCEQLVLSIRLDYQQLLKDVGLSL